MTVAFSPSVVQLSASLGGAAEATQKEPRDEQGEGSVVQADSSGQAKSLLEEPLREV